MELSKNIKNFYLYKMATGAIIIGPIIMIYLLEVKNLSFTQAMFLSSAAAISMVIFEVPTGAVADYWGRKISLLIGSIFLAISLGFYIFAQGFWMCLIAEVLFSFGFAFNSGADTALLYDSLLELGQEDRFSEIAGIAQARLFWVQAVGSIAAGFMFEKYVHLPMIISIVFMIISAFIVLRFKEPNFRDIDQEKPSYWNQVSESAKYIVNHTKIKAVLAYSTVFYVFYRLGFLLFQPYMTGVKMPIRYIGIMFFLFNVTAAITSQNSHKIITFTKRRTLAFLSSTLIISFVLMGLINHWVGSFAILLQQVARGLYGPVTRKYFNKHISSEKRATVLSFVSLVTRLATSIAYPFLGLLRDNYSINTTLFLLAGAMICLTAVSLFYIKDKLGVVGTVTTESAELK